MKRFVFPLIIIVLLVFVFIYLQGNDRLSTNLAASKNIKEVPIKTISQNKALEEKTLLSKKCDDYKLTLSSPELETSENRRWSNYHIKYIDGEIYRIRYFYDDGPNGEYQKTVLYKEDESEFAHIIRVFKGFEVNALKDYFERGEVIWEEQAYEANLGGKPTYWRKINGEFVDLNIDEELSCL